LVLNREAAMVDAAYYRRQAATCRELANNSTRTERCFLDLADHFDRRAAVLEAKSTGNKAIAWAEATLEE
jgi:hypothetical protein